MSNKDSNNSEGVEDTSGDAEMEPTQNSTQEESSDSSESEEKKSLKQQRDEFREKTQQIQAATTVAGKAAAVALNPVSLKAGAIFLAIAFIVVAAVSALQVTGPNENECEGDNCSVICGSTSPGGSTGSVSKEFSLGNKPKARQAKLLSELQTRLGLTKAQASGMIGNFMQESGPSLNPKALNPASGAFGLAQWLGGRKDKFQDFAKKNYGGKFTDASNLAFLIHEVTEGDEQAGFKKFKNDANAKKDPAKAAHVWEKEFERSGGDANSQRTVNATIVFKLGNSAGASNAVDNVCSGSSVAGGPLIQRLNKRADEMLKIAKKYPSGPALIPGFDVQGVFGVTSGWGSACTAISMMIYGKDYVGLGNGKDRVRMLISSGFSAKNGKYVPGKLPPPGSILSWNYPGPGHVAIYLGNDRVVENWCGTEVCDHKLSNLSIRKGVPYTWALPKSNYEGNFLVKK